jgi:hypothetical protein
MRYGTCTSIAGAWQAHYGSSVHYETQLTAVAINSVCGTGPYYSAPRSVVKNDLWQAARLDCGCGARDFTHAKDGYMRCTYCGGQPR